MDPRTETAPSETDPSPAHGRLRVAIAVTPDQSVPPTYDGNAHRLTAALAETLTEAGHLPMLIGAAAPRLEVDQVPVHRPPMQSRADMLAALEQAILTHLHRFDVLHVHHAPSPDLTEAVEDAGIAAFRWLHRFDEAGATPEPWTVVRTHPDIATGSDADTTVLPGILASRFHLTSGADGYCALYGDLSDLDAAQRACDMARLNRMVVKMGGGNALDGPFRKRQFERLRKPRSPTAVQEQGAMIASQRQFLFGNAAVALFTLPGNAFDVSLLEAMACGTPVVVFGVPAMEQFVEEGVTGYVARDAEGAVTALAKARHLDRRAIRARFEERWTARRMMEEAMGLAPGPRNGSADSPLSSHGRGRHADATQLTAAE